MKPAHSHPKMRKLTAFLRPLMLGSQIDPQTAATGLLERLWYYTAESHRSGFLVGVDADLLAAEIGWYGTPLALVDALVSCGWLDSSEGILVVHDWLEHCPQWVHGANARALQAAEAKKLKVDLKEKLKDSLKKPIKDDINDAPSLDLVPCSLIPVPCSLNNKPSPPARSVGYSDEFESFWQAYPKKTGKGVAWESWKKRKSPIPEISQVLKSIEDNKKSHAWEKDGGQFIPMPSTWINQRRWDDEVSYARPASYYAGLDNGRKDGEYGTGTMEFKK